MRCTACGKENEPSANFCIGCGTPLRASMPASAEAGEPAAGASAADAPAEERVRVANASGGDASSADASAENVSNTAGAESHVARPSRSRKPIIAGIAVALVLALGGGAGYYFGIYLPERERLAAEEAARRTYKVVVRISAPGWDTGAGASRLPIRVSGEDLQGEKVDEIQYVDSDGEGIELRQGSYGLTAPASPIAAGGTIFTVPTESVKIVVAADGDDGSNKEPSQDNSKAPDSQGSSSAEKDDASDGEKPGAGSEASDSATSPSFDLKPIDPSEVTDEQIDSAYDYACKDDGEHAPDADALKDAAVGKRDEAVEEKKAEEAAAAAKAARHVDAGSFEFDLPEAWDGLVKVESVAEALNYDGDGVIIALASNPKVHIVQILRGPADSDMGPHAIPEIYQEKDMGDGTVVGLWANNMTVYYLQMQSAGVSYEDMSTDDVKAAAAAQLVGTVSYDDFLSRSSASYSDQTMTVNDVDLYNQPMDAMFNAIAPSIKLK